MTTIQLNGNAATGNQILDYLQNDNIILFGPVLNARLERLKKMKVVSSKMHGRISNRVLVYFLTEYGKEELVRNSN